jgi:cell division septum initiation protein DivIVA
MSNESIIRKSFFGGFNRADVLDYIEMLQRENADLRQGIDDRENILASLEEAYNTCASLREEKESLEKANVDLLEQAKELTEENAKLKEALEEARVNSAVPDAFNDPDDKGGAVIRGAVKYADSIVDAAKQNAADIMLAAKERIDMAAEGIVQAQERANTARSNLDFSLVSVGESINAMLDSLGTLTDELSGDNQDG